MSELFESLVLELANNLITILVNQNKKLRAENLAFKAKLMDYEILYGNPETDYLFKPLGKSPLESLFRVTT